jgi:flavoprotein
VVASTDLIKSATLYDITGRLITSSPNTLITNSITLSTTGIAGVYIVDVTLRDGSTEQAQVIVQ